MRHASTVTTPIRAAPTVAIYVRRRVTAPSLRCTGDCVALAFRNPLQLVGQVVCGLPPVIRVFCETLVRDAIQHRRRQRLKRRHRRKLAIDDGRDDGRGAVPLECPLACRHLVDDGAEAEDVAASCQPLCLRAAPVPCTATCPGSCLRPSWARVVGTIDELPPVMARPLAFANPKSSNFAPDFVSMMLPGFRSRWTIPWRCALSSASAI